MTRNCADADGYIWCPSCEQQLSATQYCDDCEGFAWEHPEPLTLEQWKAKYWTVTVSVDADGRGRLAA